MRKEIIIVVAIAILALLSACTAARSEGPEAAMSAPAAPAVEPAAGSQAEDPAMEAGSKAQADQNEADIAMGSEMPDSSEEMAAGPEDEAPMGPERPAWQQLALIDARSGESFTLADFAGKTVFVEPMATWCSNCRQQLNNVREAKGQLVGENVVFVALSVETNIDDATLAGYADGEGFDWLFAVATPELLAQLAGEFGLAITNPPATPHFIIRADGTSTELVTGIEPAGQIVSQISAAQG